MKPIDDKKDTVAIRVVSHDEEGRKRVEKKELSTHNIDTIKYVEKKLIDKGVQRMDRHPIGGIGIGRPPSKSGHGGKYTWEGPGDVAEYEMDPVPAAIDEGDPNYVDEEVGKRIVKGKEADVAVMVVGEVEVAKVAENKEGVARIEVDPQLNAES
ncbi:uncharacterized protein LOC126797774 [Argentina anserina]|uniref:uncharacterized protein LOC126797774 n=1 Tax=Argentina anserina TaxID=57926 RepID=UPI0021762584|nr:uncharacterized protein LOC126797774 [Potentilla anserina]